MDPYSRGKRILELSLKQNEPQREYDFKLHPDDSSLTGCNSPSSKCSRVVKGNDVHSPAESQEQPFPFVESSQHNGDSSTTHGETEEPLAQELSSNLSRLDTTTNFNLSSSTLSVILRDIDEQGDELQDMSFSAFNSSQLNDSMQSKITEGPPSPTTAEQPHFGAPAPTHVITTCQSGAGRSSTPNPHAEPSSTEIPETSVSETSSTKRKKGASEWKQNKRTKLREHGQAYERDEKQIPARQLKEPCSCKSTGTRCQDLSESDHKAMFDYVWSLSWGEKAAFLKGLIERQLPTRKRVPDSSRRNWTIKYYLQKEGGGKVPVCKTMFTNTTALGEWYIRSVLTERDENLPEAISTAASASSSDDRPRNDGRSYYSRAAEDKSFLVEQFFNQLPKVPSHYCRKQTGKLYIEPLFNSLAALHREYVTLCHQNGRTPLGIKVFTEIFNDENLSLYKPRKDQCDVCAGNIAEEVWEKHRSEKARAQREKCDDKNLAASSDGKVCALTMDLQSVLLAPSLKASALYYKTKLSVHNFTVFDLATKDVKCYVWHEGEGGLSANDFASSIVDYLQTKTGCDKVIIYSDGCAYQNRNAVLPNAISEFCSRSGLTVEHKYLVKGHTYMEVDSVHMVIEKALKDAIISAPMDYVNIFRKARVTGKPYEVTYLNHAFFRNYTKAGQWKSIRPGRSKGDPMVTDIRCLKYSPDGNIEYKLSFDNPWTGLPKLRGHETVNIEPPTKLYDGPLKIKESKFRHLQELKPVILKDYWSFFDNLNH